MSVGFPLVLAYSRCSDDVGAGTRGGGKAVMWSWRAVVGSARDLTFIPS